MICSSAARPGHNDDVAGTKHDRNWIHISGDPPNEKDSGISQPVKKKSESLHVEKKSRYYEMDTKGEVAQTSERSTCPQSVSWNSFNDWHSWPSNLTHSRLIVIHDASIRF